jgi:hypothetical protein
MENILDLPEELQVLYRALPEFVDRKAVSRLTGGLVSPATLASMDCRGVGPDRRICGSKKVHYPRLSLCRWLAGRVVVKNAGE